VLLPLSRRRSTRVAATAFLLVVAVAAGTCEELARSRLVAAVPGPAVVELRLGPGSDGGGRAAAVSQRPLEPGRTGAFLLVRDAASLVEVRLTDLPGLLYRITTPAGSGLAPRVGGAAGQVTVRLRSGAGDGPDTVLILLNRRVRWDIRLPAGAGEQHLDLRQGRVGRLDLGSAGLARVRLPAAGGVVPVTLLGGMGTVAVTAPRRTPVRVHLSAGAGSVVVPWRAGSSARTGNAVVMAPQWPARADRYSVEARSPVAALILRDTR
jgi:hypothetical protein